MADEEIQRAMEFMIQQQAQYTARLERDEARLARLEESFTMLVELARVADERQDRMDERQDTMLETMATLSQAMNDLVKRTMTDEMRIVRLEDALTRLAELAHKHE